MATDLLSEHERRPGVFVFRNHLSRTERRRWVTGFLVAALTLNVAALAVWLWPALSVDVRSNVVPLLHVVSWMPAFLALMSLITPQSTLRISPRGLWYAETRWGLIPWTAKRWRLRWDEITRLKWRGARSQFRSGQVTRRAALPGSKSIDHRSIREALEIYLSSYFDLSEGTVDVRLSRKWRAWSWKRKLLDKLLLVAMVCGIFGPFAAVGYAAGFVLIPTLGVLAFLAATCGMFVYLQKLSQFGWQPPRAERR